jgi:small subunit ribosomal protein S1
VNEQGDNLQDQSGAEQASSTPEPQGAETVSAEPVPEATPTPATEAAGPLGGPSASASAETLPTETPPTETPPAETPPTETPPAETPPAAPPEPAPKYRVGQRLWGKVVRLTDAKAYVTIDEDELDEGVLDLLHLRDDFGNLSISEGDGMQVYVIGLHPHLRLATSLFPPASEVMKRLAEAREKGEHVRGRVSGVNRGGLDVLVDGRRAFCPFSQIELGRCEKPEIYLNHILEFKVLELEPEKKKIILSHREIMLDERRQKAEELRSQITEGAEFDGVVMRLQPFGAFVDIGGVDGLVHVSEITHDRIQDPSEVLKVGEKVRVKVMGMAQDKQGRERIRLSMRAIMADPWSRIHELFHEGDIVTGRVVRVAEFGSFVKIHPGVEGLLHVSQYKPRTPFGARGPQTDAAEQAGAPSPADAPAQAGGAGGDAPIDANIPLAGQDLTVKIARIEAERRRVSLVLRDEDRPDQPRKQDHDGAVGDRLEGVVRTVKPYGVFLDLPSLGPWVSGLLPGQETGLPREANLRKVFPVGEKFEVQIIDIDDQGRIRLSRRSIVEAPEGEATAGDVSAQGKTASAASPGGFNVLAEALKRAQEKTKPEE